MTNLTEQQKTEMFGEIGTPMRTLYEDQMNILKENSNETNPKLELPKARKVYAETIPSEVLDAQLLEEAKLNGFETYDEYWKFKLSVSCKKYEDFMTNVANFKINYGND